MSHTLTRALPDTVRAEYDRLLRAITNGPARRMAADIAAGRTVARADVAQAERYQRLMDALTRDYGDGPGLAPVPNAAGVVLAYATWKARRMPAQRGPIDAPVPTAEKRIPVMESAPGS